MTKGAETYVPSECNLGISCNTDGQTARHLVAAMCDFTVAQLLCWEYPHTGSARHRKGCTALHLVSKFHLSPVSLSLSTGMELAANRFTRAISPEENSSLETLLRAGANVCVVDKMRNNCLHYATAWGNLMAIRMLIQAGTDPVANNVHGWTPEYYSLTVQAELYYRNSIAEYERRIEESKARLQATKERKRQQNSLRDWWPRQMIRRLRRLLSMREEVWSIVMKGEVKRQIRKSGLGVGKTRTKPDSTRV